MANFQNQRELLDFGKENLLDLKLYKALEKLGKDYVVKMTRILVANDKQATGDLIRSLDYEVLYEADKLLLNLYAATYLENVINGRRPGAKPPPYRVLLPWIRARNIKFVNQSEVGTAIIIARSIGKKGIKPVPQIREVLNSIYTTQRDFIAKAAREDIEKVIQKYLVMGFLR
jgi:hypothetical protein